uniref:Uncharacterized protein n=1 Tax=Cacopsylla melanoneura TaxID=428564 RepID=A0A8D9BZW4_9HEMI
MKPLKNEGTGAESSYCVCVIDLNFSSLGGGTFGYKVYKGGLLEEHTNINEQMSQFLPLSLTFKIRKETYFMGWAFIEFLNKGQKIDWTKTEQLKSPLYREGLDFRF